MDEVRKKPRDEGTAYGRKPQHHDAEITEVGPGTPCGEFMRRYWHPVALSDKRRAAAAERPHPRRGSDPVPRPRRAGRACFIRAAPIAARRSITAGSRMTASAAAITAGCSMSKGAASISRASPRAAARATPCASPGIRVEERYGLVFAYLGPPEKKPVLPRYDCLETSRAGRVHPRRRRLDRRRRRPHGRDRADQLAQRLGKRDGPVPSPDPAHDLQRRAVRARVRRHAGGEVGAGRSRHALRRLPQARGRARDGPHHPGAVPACAHRARRAA